MQYSGRMRHVSKEWKSDNYVMDDSSEDSKSRATKRKKATLPKDPNAPKRPVTAYIIFSTEVRQKLHSDQPEMGFVELMKHIGGLWNNLPQAEKQRYFDTAEKDKERYMREYSAYQQTESYKQFMKSKYPGLSKGVGGAKKESHKSQKGSPKEPSKSQASSQQDPKEPKPPSSKPTPLSSQQDFVPGTDIPIFTDQFLHHNREMEAELRKLRHANGDLEEENALLSRHVEGMKTTVDKLNSEIAEQQSRNTVLRDHLRVLRGVLAEAFRDTPLPGTDEAPTRETVDTYLGQLQDLVASDARGHEGMVAAVREVAGRLEEELGQRLESKSDTGTEGAE